jgi:hypothetical protein
VRARASIATFSVRGDCDEQGSADVRGLASSDG